MSGSFKKAAKAHQKVHKERSQPTHRAKYGFLEKHKDYVERARDHHKKRDKIKVLRKKAADRNPDEFYFNMVNTEKLDGVHMVKKDKMETTTPQQEMLMQREDLRYVAMKRSIELKKIEKLQAELQLLDPNFRQNKHTVFVDEEKDASVAKAHLQQCSAATKQILAVTPEQQQEMEKKYGLLNKRYERLKELTTVMQKLEMSLHLSKDKKAKKKLVKEETKDSAAVYRWCFQRKR